MTVSSVSQSFSFTAVRLNVSVRPVTTAAAAPLATTTAEPDRVTLTPAATAPAEAVPAAGAPVSRVERRADALFGALDADQDGAITEQEFTEGAAALLRRAGHRHRARGGDGDDHGGEEHRAERGAERGGGRLHRKLEKAFARVDANQDGSIDKDELAAALAAAKRPERGQGAFPAPPADPAPPGAPNAPVQGGGTSVSFTFTYVTIAVQRYTALQTPTGSTSVTSTPTDAARDSRLLGPPVVEGTEANAQRAA